MLQSDIMDAGRVLASIFCFAERVLGVQWWMLGERYTFAMREKRIKNEQINR